MSEKCRGISDSSSTGQITAAALAKAKAEGRLSPSKRPERDIRSVVLHRWWCAWRLLRKCFPPVSAVRRYFYAWRDAGLFDTINMVLVMNLREIEGREASPSASVIDSQSVKTTESGGVCGYDAVNTKVH